MAITQGKAINFAVKRLDHSDTEDETSYAVSVIIKEDDSVADVTHSLRTELQLNNPDLVLRARNGKGSLVPLNGNITQMECNGTRPLDLEVVQRFQSVQPMPISLQLPQYVESLKNKMLDIKNRLDLVETSMENMHERRKDKVHKEISTLENTVNFLKKRLEEAETIEWRGMFVKNPLW